MGIMTLFNQPRVGSAYSVLGLSRFCVAYLSISVTLNVLLTLMIVIRLILHGRKVRTATGSLVGISELYKTISTMFIESCALFTMSSMLVIGALAAYIYSETPDIYVIGEVIVEIFYPILAEIQVRDFPRRPSRGQLSNATTDRTGDRTTAHHSTGCQRERVDGPRCHHWTHQFVQC